MLATSEPRLQGQPAAAQDAAGCVFPMDLSEAGARANFSSLRFFMGGIGHR